jgi:hypothetical protein
MPLWRTHKKQTAGQPISARTLRTVAETADWIARADASAPFGMTSTAGGLFLRWAGQVFGAHVCISSSTITARSGSTLGSGTATIQGIAASGSPAAPALTALSGVADIKVYNISSATGGIPSGKYMVVLKIAGFYFVITSEC